MTTPTVPKLQERRPTATTQTAAARERFSASAVLSLPPASHAPASALLHPANPYDPQLRLTVFKDCHAWVRAYSQTDDTCSATSRCTGRGTGVSVTSAVEGRVRVAGRGVQEVRQQHRVGWVMVESMPGYARSHILPSQVDSGHESCVGGIARFDAALSVGGLRLCAGCAKAASR